MNTNFNMDVILGYSKPRKTCFTNVRNNLDECTTTKSQSNEEKDDGMLPDSSLSPSNNFGIDKNIDGFVKQKLRCDIHKYPCVCQFKIVYDSSGNQYYVSEKYLVNIKDSEIFEKCPQSPFKECNSTYNEIDDYTKTDNHNMYNNEKEIQEDNRLATFLYATQLALIEVKFKELEKDLLNLDDLTLSKLMNSASNLKHSEMDYFVSEEQSLSFNSLIPYDLQSNKNDDLRRKRLNQIIKRHSELKRSLSKFKKKLKQQQQSSKLLNIVDFSAFESNSIPLPEYVKHQINVSSSVLNSPTNPDFTSSIEDDNLSRSDIKDKSHVDYLSDLVDANYNHETEDENSNLNKSFTQNIVPNNEEDIEAELTKSQYFKKNIFSTILLLSKNYPTLESIPQLTYESENYRDCESNYNEPRSCTEDNIVSVDLEYPINRNPPTPDLRKAELDSNDISEGIRVLIVQQNYLRAGVIQLANNENNDQKLWQVKLDGDRKCQDIVISEWQLLEQGVREVIPTSIHQLTQGARVCANWSVQLPLNLYPGTISQCKTSHRPNCNTLPIDFDDGDHKEIDLDQVRLLPENFPNLHELMKTSNVPLTNFYTTDRKIRIRHKTPGKLSKSVSVDANNNGMSEEDIMNKKLLKTAKRRKLTVHWKLCKNTGDNPNGHESLQLVRNIDNMCVTIGNNVQLLSYSKGIYLANIVKILTKRQSSIMEVEFNWYYILSDVHDNSDLIKKLKKSKLSKLIIFQTNHSDINDIYSVIKKVEVLSFEDYKSKYLNKSCKTEPLQNTYIIAGKYNQSKSKVESVDEDIKLYIYANDY